MNYFCAQISYFFKMKLPHDTRLKFNIVAVIFSLLMGAAIACLLLIDDYDMSEVACIAPAGTGCLLAGIYLAVNHWEGRGWEQLALLMEGYSMGCAFLLAFFVILFFNLGNTPEFLTLALGCMMAIGSILLIGLLLAIPLGLLAYWTYRLTHRQ